MDNEIIYQLILSVILGGLLGIERKYKRKEAGLQTYSLIVLGTCLFTIVALEMNNTFNGDFDVLRIIQAVAVGIGFIGAGVIFQQSSGVMGLTTAAGLWVASAIGVAVGTKFYFLAAFATLLSLIIFIIFGILEVKIFKKD
ncbi:MAG: MgtC/SapB family protein [Patescibacteria group bacterium]|nr:MgtC/SapB family protein [Patescibacteria group bacterium]